MLFQGRKTHRISFAALLASVFLFSAIFAGCGGEQAATDKKTTPVGASSVGSANKKAHFSPSYEVGNVSDPIVAKVLEGTERATSPVERAEIVGYLIDWTARQADDVSIREAIVMKDGTLFNNPLQIRPSQRPLGAFGRKPSARLTPESAEEASARNASMVAARENLKKIERETAFVKISKPMTFGYLVRIHRQDRSSYDVLVNPDGTGQVIVGTNYKPLR